MKLAANDAKGRRTHADHSPTAVSRVQPEQASVVLTEVTHSYQDAGQRRVVLRALNARFYPGEFSVVQGRSGSGKSTLLNLIAGIDLPDAGRIEVAGQDLAILNEQARTELRRRELGLVFQFFNLIPTLTVAENIRLPMELNGADQTSAISEARTLLNSQDLGDRGESYPEQLSGGEQQRVAILRAVAHRPSVLLADEPSGNLDHDNEQKVLQLLTALPQHYGCTVIAATHSEEVAARADRRYYLQAGHLVGA